MAKKGGPQQFKRQISDPCVLRNPLNVVVEKFGDESARVCGDLSKNRLRDLLMPSLTIIRDVSSDAVGLQKKPTEKKQTGKLVKKGVRVGDVDDDVDAREKEQTAKGVVRSTSKSRRTADSSKQKRRTKKDEVRTKKDELRTKKDQLRTKEDQLRRKVGKAVSRGVAVKDTKYVEEYGEQPWPWFYSDDQSLDTSSESLPSCQSSDRLGALLSYDGVWLRKHIQYPLRLALREIIAKKPVDPVSYLGFWLMNYRKSEEAALRMRQLNDELQNARSLIEQPVTEEKIESFEYAQPEVYGEQDTNFAYYELHRLTLHDN